MFRGSGLIGKGAAHVLAGVIALACATQARADRTDEIRAQLRKFNENPREFSLQPILKTDDEGNPVTGLSVFPASSVANRDFVLEKDRLRAKRFHPAPAGRAAFLVNDLASDLVDQFELLTPESMEQAALTSAALPSEPWSDNYWPVYEGVLANRYADRLFPNSKDWKANADYVLGTLAQPTVNSSSVDDLSPAEKYDLLVGDPNKTLTRQMMNEGSHYYALSGAVETWMGICHGWSPASFMYARPANTITLAAADGQTRIKFFPSDIKGLASALWANAQPQVRFIGGRCQVKNPATDANGRIIDQNCFDTNPGTWHLAIVNQLGLSKRGFVLDATYDYEVWNQPAYAYSYTYFNPQSGAPVASVAQAKALLKDFPNDKFKTYRSPQAEAVVGIAMDLTYIAELLPSHVENDGPAMDRKVNVRYLYDLELDHDGKIIGGEWYQIQHPDFLWTPAPGTRAVSIGDSYLERDSSAAKWDGISPVPSTWLPAIQASSQRSQPLAQVVDMLVTLSNLGQNAGAAH